MQHTPVRTASTSAGAQSATSAPTTPDHQSPAPGSPPLEHSALAVDATSRCKLPSYWAFNPRLWFAQAEAVFNTNRVRADASRYDLLVAHLPPDVAQEVADVILSPPEEGKYEALKKAVLQRLALSSDRELHQLLNEVQLGDRTPSQLLRHMKRLAGSAVSDDALRIKWLDLLPPHASRICRVLKATSLDELAALADELLVGSLPIASPQSILAVDRSKPGPAASSDDPPVDSISPQLTQELASIRLCLSQITTILQQQAASSFSGRPSPTPGSFFGRSRSRSKTPSRPSTPRLRADSADRTWCWYHANFGDQATQCRQPCSFSRSEN